MQDKSVIDFINESRSKGATDAEIRASLITAGWDKVVIDDSFASMGAKPMEPVKQVQAVQNDEKKSHIVVPEQDPSQTKGELNTMSGAFVQPQVVGNTLPEMPQGNGKRSWKKIVLISVIVFVLVIIIASVSVAYAAVGLGKTVFGVNLPDKMWQDLIDRSAEEMAERNVSINYVDGGNFTFIPSKAAEAFGESLPEEEAQKYDSQYTFTLKDMDLKYSADGFYDLRNENSPKLDMHFGADAKNNGHTYTTALDIKFKEPNAFFKFDFNQEVMNILKRFDPSIDQEISVYKDKWLKVNSESEGFKEMEREINGFTMKPTEDETQYEKEQREKGLKIKEILKANRLIDIESFKGFSKVNGNLTFHYQLSINKQKFRNFIVEATKIQVGPEEFEKDKENRDYFLKILDTYLDKWQLKNFEVWVSPSDKKIYKSQFTSNLVSIIGVANMIKEEAENGNIKRMIELESQSYMGGGDPTDAKRLSDIRQVASALELYYNDYNTYPLGENGVPKGLAPKYIPKMPTAPEPPSGKCTKFYNNYWYRPDGYVESTNERGVKEKVYTNYKLSFCLGGVTGGYEEGNHYLTASGIGVLNDCPASRKCYEDVSANEPPVKSEKSAEEQIKDYVIGLFQKVPFTAELRINSEAKSYNKDKNIEEPKDFKDLEEEIKKLENNQQMNRT